MMTVAKKFNRLWVALCVAALILCAVAGSLFATTRAAADEADAKAPIASYKFDDPTNPGKNSAGGGT